MLHLLPANGLAHHDSRLTYLIIGNGPIARKLFHHTPWPATAAKIVETALSRFKSIDALVNNAGIFFTKPFTDYTAEDFKSLVSTNVEGFLYVTQLSIKQMLAQKTGGSIVTITAALARNPIRGVTAAVPMATKGGLETITQHLAMEYAKDGIRVNAVAPGVVYTPLHRETPKDVMESLSPMGRPSTVKDITDAVMYLTDAATVTGDILYVDGGSHFGRWNGSSRIRGEWRSSVLRLPSRRWRNIGCAPRNRPLRRGERSWPMMPRIWCRSIFSPWLQCGSSSCSVPQQGDGEHDQRTHRLNMVAEKHEVPFLPQQIPSQYQAQ